MNNKAALIKLLILGLTSLVFGLTAIAKEEGTSQQDPKLIITNVSLKNKSFDPTKEEAHINYKLSSKARISVRIYDRDDFLVRQLVMNEPADEGYNTIAWDGKDDSGDYLHPGAYTYVVKVVSLDSKQTALYDRTDESYGKELTLRFLSYDAKTGKIEFVLPRAAMLRVRVGLKEGGPLLTTPIDWQAQSAGRNQYIWDGNIGLSDVDFRTNPMIQLNLAAYSLPDNSIIVRYSKSPKEGFSKSKSEKIRKRAKKESPFKKYLHAVHPMTKCREPQFSMEFPGVTEFTDDEVPIVSGNVPVRITVHDHDKKFLQDQRFEAVIFVDFIFLYEEEEGISPATYFLKTAGMNEGKHFLTVNLYGFKDHIGTKTKQVFVKRIKQ